jgi:hypothetical protein
LGMTVTLAPGTPVSICALISSTGGSIVTESP